MKTKITLGFILAGLMIFGAMLSSHLSISRFMRESDWTLHTVEVRNQMEKVSNYFLAAQNNIRAYHLAEQDAYYLQLHEDAKKNLGEALKRLEVLVADNEVQKKNLDSVISQVQHKFKMWEDAHEIRKKGGLKAIQDRIRSGNSKTDDAILFEAIDQFKNQETSLLMERTARAKLQGTRAVELLWFSGIVAGLLITLATYLVVRDNRLRVMAESHMDRFFNLSLDLLCISGLDGFFKKLSPSYSEILGYPLKELYEKPVTDFIHPDDIEKTVKEIESQSMGNKVMSFENRFRCKDGTYKVFSWKSVPFDGHMYAIARDVTQQKEFEQELVQAREDAQKAAVAKSEFLANMSHEIRTPLNGVVGTTDLLSRTKLDDQQKGYVSIIRQSAANLLQTVNEILDFSKIEAGRMEIKNEIYDLGRLIHSQISMIGVLASEKGLKLRTSMDSRIPQYLMGDVHKVSQVVLNLLNNAIKFTDRGEIIVISEVEEVSDSHCRVKISVKDSGIGIPPDQIQRLFEPFEQMDSSKARKYEGTGLGLSICKQMIEMMNGEIGVESSPDLGSNFWFRLDFEVPTQIQTNEKKLGAEAKGASVKNGKSTQPIRVLIAEDNQVNQAIAMGMMNVLGYAARVAKNGEEALRLYEEEPFDLILMDQHMPIMDGVQATKEIRRRENGSGRRIPIIAFTATVWQDDEKKQYENLMDDFLLKPVTLESLEGMLKRWETHVSQQRA